MAGCGQSRKPGATAAPCALKRPSSFCQSRYGPQAFAVVADVEDRHVRPTQDAPCRGRRPRAARRPSPSSPDEAAGPDHDQAPQRLAVPRHGDPRRAGAAHRRRLVRARGAAAARRGQRRRRRPAVEAHDLAPAELHADDLMAVAAARRPQADGDGPLDRAVRQLLARQRRHRAVRDQPPVAQRRPELGVLAHHARSRPPAPPALGSGWRALDDHRRRALRPAARRPAAPAPRVVVDRRAHGARAARARRRRRAAADRRAARRRARRSAPQPRLDRDRGPTARPSLGAGPGIETILRARRSGQPRLVRISRPAGRRAARAAWRSR